MIGWLMHLLSPPPRAVEEPPAVVEPERCPELPGGVADVLAVLRSDALRLMAQEGPRGRSPMLTQRRAYAAGVRWAAGRFARRLQLLGGGLGEESEGERKRRERMCTSKTQFETAWMANERAKREGGGLSPYRCGYCRLYHLTSDERAGLVS